MATSKKVNARARTRVAVAAETQDTAPVVTRKAPSVPDGEVMVIVPKDYTLTDDAHQKFNYTTFTRHMPRSHAEHWFSVAQGVQIVE